MGGELRVEGRGPGRRRRDQRRRHGRRHPRARSGPRLRAVLLRHATMRRVSGLALVHRIVQEHHGEAGRCGATPGWARSSPSASPSAMADTRVLVVDDELSMRELLDITLRQEGYDVTLADGGEAAIHALEETAFDLVVTDLRMRRVDGLAVLRAVKARAPDTAVLMVTAFASTDTAVEAMKLGAYDYVTKPFKLDEMRLTIANALERKRLHEENRALRRQLHRARGFANFVGKSHKMLDVFETIRKIADSSSNVDDHGRDGHGQGAGRPGHPPREPAARPAVRLRELRGDPRGARWSPSSSGTSRASFTGAFNDAPGLFSAADGGTLFLDEITEVPPSVQVKLLRAIAGTGRPSRGRHARPSTSTCGSSRRRTAISTARSPTGVLREDLFYRLNVIPVHVPPLRERRDDIPLLVAHFIEQLARETGKDVRGIDAEGAGAARAVSLAGQHPRAGERDRAGHRPGLRAHAAGRRAPDRAAPAGAGPRRRSPRDSAGRARPGSHAGRHRAAATAGGPRTERRRADAGGGAAQDELPSVPL